MKEITVDDVLELQNKFAKYCDQAEQHEFPMLLMIQIRLDKTVDMIQKAGVVEDQKDVRAMFRVVLKTIGENYEEYVEETLWK